MHANRLAWIGCLFVVITTFISCGDSGPLAPTKEKAWTPLNLTGDVFRELRLHDNRLYAVALFNGIYVQDPAVFGSWQHLGLDLADSLGASGPRGIAFVDDFLISGSMGIGEPNLLRRSFQDQIWRPIDGIEGSGILDVKELGSTILVATERLGVLLSEDLGETWVQSFGSEGLLLGDTDVYTAANIAFFGGQSSFFSPYLYSSIDQGKNWTRARTEDLNVFDGRVTSVDAWAAAEDTLVVMGLDNDLYKSKDRIAYELILETEANVLTRIRPGAPPEIWAASDSLYLSEDEGLSWRSWPPPENGVRFGAIEVDWDRHLLMAVVWPDSGDGSLYCADLLSGQR